MGFVNQVFSLHNSAEFHNCINGAGFSNVSVQADTKSLRLPPPDEFLWQYVHSTILESDVMAKWQTFVEYRPLIPEVRVVVATARK